MPNDKAKRGWGFPQHAEKMHYFVNGKSLCERWIYTGKVYDFRDDADCLCSMCAKRLARDDKKAREGEKLFDERLVQIFTSLPTETDAEIEARCKAAKELAGWLETMVKHHFGPGGQYWKPGYSIRIERR